tara:strand:- start:544 stop:693 length:150 start_codon:yes stop_codon:yes gene_type:complete
VAISKRAPDQKGSQSLNVKKRNIVRDAKKELMIKVINKISIADDTPCST